MCLGRITVQGWGGRGGAGKFPRGSLEDNARNLG